MVAIHLRLASGSREQRILFLRDVVQHDPAWICSGSLIEISIVIYCFMVYGISMSPKNMCCSICSLKPMTYSRHQLPGLGSH